MKHQPRFADYRQKVQNSFDQQSLMRTFAAELTIIDPGECTITAPILADHRQQHGFAHAGLTFALGDSAAVGRVIKPGRRLIIVGADVFARENGLDRQVALLQGTMIPSG